MMPLERIQSMQPYHNSYESMPVHLQDKAKQLCWEYNQTSPREEGRRRAILQQLFGSCDPQTFIESSFHCDYDFNIHTHGFVLLNYNCVILDTSPVHIGADVFIAPGVCLICLGHATDPAQRAEGIGSSAPITIEDRAWIGANVTVCGGVSIGEGSVIGAGSTVIKDIPAGVIAAGVPCKVLRPITEADKLKPEEISF